MKKVLIISEIFAPQNSIAAIRLTKIAKYLSLAGYDIDVLTRIKTNTKTDRLLAHDLKYVNNIFFNDNSKLFSLIYLIYRKIDGKLSRIFSFWETSIIAYCLRFIMLELYQIEYSFRAQKLLKKIYNIVFSSFGPISGHLIAYKLKKKYPNIRWIADFRDPIFSRIGKPWKFKKYINKQWNMIIEKSDHVTGSTPQSILHSGYKRFHVLFNGFDKEDCFNITSEKRVKNDKLVFTYAGLIYKERARMIPVLFKIISELITEKIILKDKIQINCAGGYYQYFFAHAKEFELTNILVDYGVLERIDSLKLQKQSDFLLHLTWNTEDDQDVFTGKLFECFMLNRVILSFISGTRKESAVKELIHNARVGCCYQESHHETDYFLMKNFIISYIKSTDRERFYSQNNEIIEQYNWKNNIHNLINIIEGF
jgi:hypothetical protein